MQICAHQLTVNARSSHGIQAVAGRKYDQRPHTDVRIHEAFQNWKLGDGVVMPATNNMAFIPGAYTLRALRSWGSIDKEERLQLLFQLHYFPYFHFEIHSSLNCYSEIVVA